MSGHFVYLCMNAEAPAVRTFNILLHRKTDVDVALTRLVKRATRRGIENLLTWSWGKAFPSEVFVANQDGVPPTSNATLSNSGDCWIVPVTRIPLALEGTSPRLHGWRFIAALTRVPTDEGSELLVRALPGEELDPRYLKVDSVCDHCKTSRRRNETYLLAHEDGRIVQVGSSCITDFLGSDEAEKLAAKAELLATAHTMLDEGESFGMGGGFSSGGFLLATFLGVVVRIIRAHGWKSRKTVLETGGMSTSDLALVALDKMRRESIKDERTPEEILADQALASGAEEWAEHLSDDETQKSNYLHNLRVIARSGTVSHKSAGFAASMIIAYQNHLGRERLRAERAARPKLDAFLGEVGSRVSFGLPAKVGKKGQPLKNAPVVLSAEPLLLDFVTGFETDFGYTTILKFRTPEGASIVWKASGSDITRADVGKRYTVLGTIKKHEEYKGDKQTVLTRCTVEEVPEAPAVDGDGLAA